MNLALGYDYITHPNYIRFPLWIMHLVQPEMTFEELEKRIEEINNPAWRLNADRDRLRCKYLITILMELEES